MMTAVDIMGIITLSSLSVLLLTLTGLLIAFVINELRD